MLCFELGITLIISTYEESVMGHSLLWVCACSGGLWHLVHFIMDLFQMGGRSTVQNEILCRFIFPERPGALMKFLDAFSPRWNISLFHYRGQVGIKKSVHC